MKIAHFSLILKTSFLIAIILAPFQFLRRNVKWEPRGARIFAGFRVEGFTVPDFSFGDSDCDFSKCLQRPKSPEQVFQIRKHQGCQCGPVEDYHECDWFGPWPYMKEWGNVTLCAELALTQCYSTHVFMYDTEKNSDWSTMHPQCSCCNSQSATWKDSVYFSQTRFNVYSMVSNQPKCPTLSRASDEFILVLFIIFCFGFIILLLLLAYHDYLLLEKRRASRCFFNALFVLAVFVIIIFLLFFATVAMTYMIQSSKKETFTRPVENVPEDCKCKCKYSALPEGVVYFGVALGAITVLKLLRILHDIKNSMMYFDYLYSTDYSVPIEVAMFLNPDDPSHVPNGEWMLKSMAMNPEFENSSGPKGLALVTREQPVLILIIYHALITCVGIIMSSFILVLWIMLVDSNHFELSLLMNSLPVLISSVVNLIDYIQKDATYSTIALNVCWCLLLGLIVITQFIGASDDDITFDYFYEGIRCASAQFAGLTFGWSALMILARAIYYIMRTLYRLCFGTFTLQWSEDTVKMMAFDDTIKILSVFVFGSYEQIILNFTYFFGGMSCIAAILLEIEFLLGDISSQSIVKILFFTIRCLTFLPAHLALLSIGMLFDCKCIRLLGPKEDEEMNTGAHMLINDSEPDMGDFRSRFFGSR